MSFAEMLSALYNNGTYAALKHVLRLRRRAKYGSLGKFREKTAANRLERMWPRLSDAPRRQAQYPGARDRIDQAMARKRQFMLGQPVPGRESTADAGQQHRMARNRALGERVLRQLGIIE